MSHGDTGMLYLALLVGSAIYFYRRKKSDALLLGFGACGIYFLPAVLGTIQFPYGIRNEYYLSAVAPGVYGVMMVLVATLTAVTACYDRFVPSVSRRIAVVDDALPEILIAVTAIGLAASIASVGKNYLCIEKEDMLAHINGWYYIASYSAPFALVSAVVTKKWWVAGFSAIVLMADMFIGFRAASSIAVIALCLAFGQALFGGVKQRAVFVGVALVVGAGLFVVKQLAWNIKYTVSMDCSAHTGASARGAKTAALVEGADDAHAVHLHLGNLRHTTNLLFSPSTYVDALRYSEPMVTQAILNEVVKQDFRAPFPNLFEQIISGLPGGRSIFHLGSTRVISFNEQFQRALFPRATFGMANNPWAQAYAGGGFALVFVFAFTYAAGLALLSGLTARVSPAIGGLLSVLAGWWGFYVHRNDVQTELGIMQMTLCIAVIAVAVNFALGRFVRRKQLSKLEHR